MEKKKKKNTNNLISRIKARANADKNAEVKKSPDSLILRIKRRANADKNKDRERYITISIADSLLQIICYNAIILLENVK